MLEDCKDANLLYEYLRLDVQSGSDLQTSQVVNAIALVQFYVTRCLMNPEEGVNPAMVDPKQWEWMQNLRVWQANRKVFLYPENFIESDLRNLKTPVFDKVVDKHTPGELSKQDVINAYMGYFEEFAEVASLLEHSSLRPCSYVANKHSFPATS